MPAYTYVAKTSTGAIERGRIVGAGPADAKERLAQRGRRLVGIQPTDVDSDRRDSFPGPFHFRLFRTLRASDVELMLQQLTVMLASGLELSQSLRELSLLSSRRQQKQLCTELAEAVEQGSTLADAFTRSQSFSPVVAQLARVGEETGELPTTLQRAAEFVESRRQTVSNLWSALAYPVFVAMAACSVAAYLVGWAIPKLAVFLHAMGRKLPTMTQSLLDVAGAIQVFGPHCLVMLAAAAVALVLFYIWRPGRYQIDRYLLSLPIVGPLMRMAETNQLASSLALMLRSGVFLPEALETAATLHYNYFLSEQVARARKKLALGQDLASSIRGFGFSPMLASMIAVGERTGDLPNALEHVAKFYAAQVETKLKRIARLIEPTIIVFVGGLVGYVYIAFFMALLSAGGNFK